MIIANVQNLQEGCSCWKKSFNNYFSNLLFVEINLVSDGGTLFSNGKRFDF